MIRRFKLWLKTHRNAKNPLLRWGIWLFDRCVAFVRQGKALLTDRNARAIWYMKTFQRKRVHQTTAATCMDRYPELFTACQEYFSGQKGINILSFGCSTGEEVLSLRQYFPEAVIVGAEINKNSLKICRSLAVDENIHFIDSRPEKLHEHAPYDVIFCMAVFQRTPCQVAQKDIRDLSRIYPFRQFEQQLIELDSFLRPGGLMVIHFSQYDLTDTALAPNYRPLGDYHQNWYGPYVFGPDSKIKENIGHRHSIFIKKGH